jgi:hypothetical protein
MKRVAKFLGLAAGDRGLLLEAALLLLAARAALRLFPFRWIVRAVSRPPAIRQLDEIAAQALVRRVSWAVRAGARHGIGRAVCFPQGIVAQVMLARRGISCTLHYGVAKSPQGELEAHVWVRAGACAVVGCESADRFTPLVSFPRRTSDAFPAGQVR